MTRIVTLDTETTGTSARLGHRIIGVGALEIMDDQITGRQFYACLQPGCRVDCSSGSGWVLSA